MIQLVELDPILIEQRGFERQSIELHVADTFDDLLIAARERWSNILFKIEIIATSDPTHDIRCLLMHVVLTLGDHGAQIVCELTMIRSKCGMLVSLRSETYPLGE